MESQQHSKNNSCQEGESQKFQKSQHFNGPLVRIAIKIKRKGNNQSQKKTIYQGTHG